MMRATDFKFSVTSLVIHCTDCNFKSYTILCACHGNAISFWSLYERSKLDCESADGSKESTIDLPL